MRTLADRLKGALAEAGMSQAELARAATEAGRPVTQQNVQQLLAGRNQTSKHLPALARALGVSLEWLTTGEGDSKLERSGSATINQQKLGTHLGGSTAQPRNVTNDGPEDTLKVLGMAEGGPDGWAPFNGETVQIIPRPSNLLGVPGAYAVYISGHSMEPRYRAGEILHIHPGKPVRPGDYVLVQRRPRQEGEPPLAVVKLLVKRTASRLVLSQHNPNKEIEIPAGDVVSIHRVVGSSEA